MSEDRNGALKSEELPEYTCVATIPMRYGYVFQPSMQPESAEMVAGLREKVSRAVTIGFRNGFQDGEPIKGGSDIEIAFVDRQTEDKRHLMVAEVYCRDERAHATLAPHVDWLKERFGAEHRNQGLV